jgi:hypothetical protein
VEAAPDDAAGWRSLIEGLLVGRRAEAAAQVCAAALERFGERVEFLTARARALSAAGLAVPARQALERAADLAPGDPEVAFGLALQALEAGAWEVAERAAARLGEAGAPSPRVFWLRARIALALGDAETACACAVAALASPGLTPDQTAETSLLLGEALDAQSRHAEAFEAAANGKGALRAFYAPRAAGRESELARVQRLQAWLAASDPASWARPSAAPAPAQVHAFLLGFPRSGTTLLEQALAGHPDVTTLEEAPTLAGAYDALMASPAGLARLSRLGDDEAAHWRGAYWSVASAHGASPAGGVFLDKAPAGTAYLPLIAQLFPRARILFALRDPRDVVLSCFRNSFQMNALTYAFTDLGETARVYAATMELAATCRRLLPLQVLDVRYERLVADFPGELAVIAAFLGVEVTLGMLDVGDTASRRVVRTPSAPQVRAGLNSSGVGRWRPYAAQLAPVESILAPWTQRFGYAGSG